MTLPGDLMVLHSVKKIRFALAIAGVLALAALSALMGYGKGIRDANEKESKAWAFLIASGWLDGKTDLMGLQGGFDTRERVESFVGHYESNYRDFVDKAAEVPDDANAKWLVNNHLNGTMTPETLRSIAEEHLKRDQDHRSRPQPAPAAE